MNTNQQNFGSNGKNKNNLEMEMDVLRNRLQTIEWDMNFGSFSKNKIPYYKKLLQEYEEMKNLIERV